MPSSEAILILGGGVREDYALPPYVESRLDLAMERATGKEIFVCLSVATTHLPPPLTERGMPIRECEAEARYLLRHGVPASRIRMESVSLDTVGNAYFSKLLHVDPAGWRNLLVITSEFHMPRSQAIFERVFGLDTAREYRLQFAASPNTALTREAVAARERREAESLQGFLCRTASIRTIREFHEWIHREHLAYAVEGIDTQREPLDAATVQSY